MYPEYWNNFLKLSINKDIKTVLEKYYQQIKKKNKIYIDNWYNLEFKSLTVNPKDNLAANENFNDKYISSLLECH